MKLLICSSLVAIALSLPAFAGNKQQEEVEKTTTETLESSEVQMEEDAQMMEEDSKNMDSSSLPAEEGADAQMQQAPTQDPSIDSNIEDTEKVDE